MPTGIYVYQYIFIVKVGLEHVVKMVFKATVFYLKNQEPEPDPSRPKSLDPVPAQKSVQRWFRNTDNNPQKKF